MIMLLWLNKENKMDNIFKAGDSVLFASTDSDRKGVVVNAIVARELERDLYDREDTGPMYVISVEGREEHAFEDELTLK